MLNAVTSKWPSGYTPLMLLCSGSSCKFTNSTIAVALISAKADADMECPRGNTALLLAASGGVIDLCRDRVEMRANLHHCNHEGKNAALLAKSIGTHTCRFFNEIGLAAVGSMKGSRSAADRIQGPSKVLRTAKTTPELGRRFSGASWRD